MVDRDEFAKAAMQGLLSDGCGWKTENPPWLDVEKIAEQAYLMADAMTVRAMIPRRPSATPMPGTGTPGS